MIQKVENNHTLQPSNIYTPFLLFKVLIAYLTCTYIDTIHPADGYIYQMKKVSIPSV